MQTTESKEFVSRETASEQMPKAFHNHAKELAEDGLNKLAAALESGKSEALINYLTIMARFHRYSWNNCLLIALQRPGASHVAGFHSWRKLGRHVRKGAKGIAILAPMVCKKRTQDAECEDEQTRVFGFRTAYVFDVADTDALRFLSSLRLPATRKTIPNDSGNSSPRAASRLNIPTG